MLEKARPEDSTIKVVLLKDHIKTLSQECERKEEGDIQTSSSNKSPSGISLNTL